MSDPSSSPALPARGDSLPRRWTLHGLNNGAIFGATHRGVLSLPRPVSYGIGHIGTWLAWRLMDDTRAAVADNLRPLFPGDTQAQLERRALTTLRSYAQDVIDFLRALRATPKDVDQLFEATQADMDLFRQLLSRQRGIILVTGHYGNWEIGSVFMRRVLDIPLAVVAMAEASEQVNRIRLEIREGLGTETIEVRKSLDTALQIRRRLAENGVVAMLMDRHLGRDRVQVNFLGRQAGFLGTPALMGYLTEAPLLPCFIERVGPGRFRVQPGEPIFVSREIPRGEAVHMATQAFATQLEPRIRAHPHHWYHFYPYWKAQVDTYDGLVE